MSDVIDLLARLVAFDTTSSKPNRACIDFVRNTLDDLGVASEIIASDDGTKACLWATIGDATASGIVLSGHSDVVPVEGQNWSGDPFKLAERGGRLFGRGACDMKGFIACVLAVAPELARAKLAKPVHLAFTHDEETDMSGAARLTGFMKSRGIRPEWVWIGEPTGHKIIDSHKGAAAFTTRITGVPGHSGKPDLGLNAIEMGVDFMSILRAVAGEKKNKPFPASRFDPPYSTFNLGAVHGGTAENIIAEHCNILWQTRTHPGDDLDATLAEIERRAEDSLDSRIKAFAPSHPAVGIKTCACCNIPPLMPTPDNPGQKLLARGTGRKQTEAVSFATEAGFFQKLGAAVVICGPGSIDQAHKADEFVEITQLSACVDLIRSVLL
jgi:acetylornithine deacetylase